MPLTGKDVAQITEADLRTLIADREPESKTIEYKRDRPGSSDGEKKEFLYDVSSFANTSGGYLVLGIEEEHGIPVKLMGISGVDGDSEIVRLEQIIRDGLRPQMSGVQSKVVPLSSGAIAIVIHIPKSWNPPHQVTYQNAFRFYGRSTNAKYQLDVDELRSIFLRSENAAEKIRLFRIDRVARVASNEAPVGLEPGAKVITHIVPLSAFTTAHAVDLGAVYQDPTLVIRMMGAGGSPVYNLNGLVSASSAAPASHYMQLFRNGSIEIVGSYSPESNARQSLPTTSFEREVITKIAMTKPIFQAIGAEPPIVILLTLLDMKGWHMGVSFGGYYSLFTLHGGVFDRSPLFIPEMILENFDTDAATAARPLIDMVWNAAGWVGSPNYTPQGVWAGDR